MSQIALRNVIMSFCIICHPVGLYQSFIVESSNGFDLKNLAKMIGIKGPTLCFKFILVQHVFRTFSYLKTHQISDYGMPTNPSVTALLRRE